MTAAGPSGPRDSFCFTTDGRLCHVADCALPTAVAGQPTPVGPLVGPERAAGIGRPACNRLCSCLGKCPFEKQFFLLSAPAVTATAWGVALVDRHVDGSHPHTHTHMWQCVQDAGQWFAVRNVADGCTAHCTLLLGCPSAAAAYQDHRAMCPASVEEVWSASRDAGWCGLGPCAVVDKEMGG